MLELNRWLAQKLKETHVHSDVRDGNTVIFQNVPVNERFFNKPRTNLLVKRPNQGMPFLVCVDEDLEYVGTDAAVTRAFASGPRRAGWRVLLVAHHQREGFHGAVENGLCALGFDEQEPALSLDPPREQPTAGRRLLESLAVNLCQLVREEREEPTVGREEEIEDVTSCLLRWGQARLSLIVGESGVGKSNLLHAVARRLNECRQELEIVCVDLAQMLAGTLFHSEREELLVAVLSEAAATPNTVLAMERLDLAVSEIPHGPLLLTQALDEGSRLIGTTLTEYLGRFERPPLARRIHVVALAEPTPTQTAGILAALRSRIAAHHNVEIDESLAGAVIRAAGPLAGHFPAKAVTILDAAVSRARLSGSREVSPDDICFAASRHCRDDR